MNNIDEKHFRGIDLNTLVVFTVLMRERSVTGAAEKLFLGQPAVSHALSRLRKSFSDKLFVRTRDGMLPTPRALEINEQLIRGLKHIEAAIIPAVSFEPRTSDAVIRFGLPDDLEICLPTLVKMMADAAPRMRLAIRPADFRSAPQQLDAGDIDVALCARPIALESWHDVEVLKHETFAAMYDAKQLGLRGNLSLKKYVTSAHILVSQNGEFSGAIDARMAELGLSRNVVIAAARFTTLPLLLKQIPAIANIPQSSVQTYAKLFDLQVSVLPFESPSFELTFVTHRRTKDDALTTWFKSMVREIVQSRLDVAHYQQPKDKP